MAKISKKQQQLVATGKKLFFRHGMKRVTVEEICQTANVSKMTFYKYFNNKLALMEFIIAEMLNEAWKKLDQVEAQEIPFPEKLQQMLEYKLKLTTQMSDEFIEEYVKLPFVEQEGEKWMGRVMQFITHAQKRGEIRSDIRPELILIMANKIQELIDDPRIKMLYFNYSELTREVWAFFYYGLVTRS